MMPLTLFNLCWTMLATGFLSFGGGLGAINIMRGFAVFNCWLQQVPAGIPIDDLESLSAIVKANDLEFNHITSIFQFSGYSQGIMMSTYIGSKLGVAGVIVGLVSFLLPTVIVMALLFKLIQKLYKYEYFQNSLKFMNIIFAGYMAVLLFNFLMTIFSIDPIFYIALAAIACYVSIVFDISPAILIGCGAIFGLIWRATNSGM